MKQISRIYLQVLEIKLCIFRLYRVSLDIILVTLINCHSWLHIPRINFDEKIVKWHWEEFLEMNICANRFYSIFWHALQRKWFPNNTESSFDRCSWNINKSTLCRHHIFSKKIKIKSKSISKENWLSSSLLDLYMKIGNFVFELFA